MLFTELDLDPRLQQAITDRGYTELTSVQERTLDKSLEGTGRGRPVPDGHGQDRRLPHHAILHRLKHHKRGPEEGPHHRPDARAGRPDRGGGAAAGTPLRPPASASSTAASATPSSSPRSRPARTSSSARRDASSTSPRRSASTSRSAASSSSTRPTASSTWASCRPPRHHPPDARPGRSARACSSARR